ncbi:MAG: hypothetical protein QXT72_04400 [Candidatus Micrarchaeia archaeon]
MIENSVIITDIGLKTGIGRYAWNLYQLGIFEKFAHLSYNGISDFKNHICFLNIGALILLPATMLVGHIKNMYPPHRIFILLNIIET